MTGADTGQQGDGQLTAQMFTELTQARQYSQAAIGIAGFHGFMPKLETQFLQKVTDPVLIALRQQTLGDAVACVQRQANGYGFTMADFVIGNGFQFVG